MATRTYPQLGAETTVEDADLLASYRSVGPLKKLPASVLRDYMRDQIPGTDSTFQQAGTGAGTQTMQAKARQMICVEDFDNLTSDPYTMIQRGLDRLHTLGGGMLYFSLPSYALTAQPVFDATNLTAPVWINGGGASLTSVGAASCLRIAGNTTIMGVTISDLAVLHGGNTDALAGFSQNGTARVTWRGCYVRASSSVLAGYGGWLLEQTDPDDANTGCFWTSFPSCGVRSDGGVVPAGIILDGGHNATDFHSTFISGVTDAIVMRRPTGTTLPAVDQPIANSVRVQGAWIEGAVNAVNVDGIAGGYSPYGLLIDSRMESITNSVLKITDSTLNPLQIPIVLLQQTLQSVAGVLDVPAGIDVQVMDLRSAGGGGASTINTVQGWSFRGRDASYDALNVLPANNGSGLGINYIGSDTVKAFTARQTNSSDFVLTTNAITGLTLKLEWTGGISSNGTPAHNLCGTATFASAATVTVTFAVDEADASYKIGGTGSANETFWVTGKGTSGFTLHSSNATSAATYDWHLLR